MGARSVRTAQWTWALPLALLACSPEPAPQPAPPPAPAPKAAALGAEPSVLVLAAQPLSNGGRPVRVLVRAVSADEHAAETYGRALARVGAVDPTVLHELDLFPGAETRAVPFVLPDGKALGVYVLLADPGEHEELRWKHLWPAPRGEVRLTVGPAGVGEGD